MSRALKGIKVVELGQHAAVPTAAAILADFGADVLKVEHPVKGDSLRGVFSLDGTTAPLSGSVGEPRSFLFDLCNRNKRSVTIDITHSIGQEMVCRLVADADVFLCNLRAREAQRYGLDYANLSKVNNRLIYGSCTGYGRTGPERDEPGFDIGAFWSRAGIAYMHTGNAPHPPFGRGGIGDFPSGLALACGVLMALVVRERSGIAQEVDTSLYGVGIWAMGLDIQQALVTGQNAAQWRWEDVRNPLWNMYRSKDDRWIMLTHIHPDPYWPKLCSAIERPDLEHDEKFNSMQARMDNNKELIRTLQSVFGERSCAEWRETLTRNGLIYAVISSPAEVAGDPQARAMGYIQELEDRTHRPVPLVAPPIRLSETPLTLRSPAPDLGQHTEEALLEVGYTWEDIVRFKENGIIL